MYARTRGPTPGVVMRPDATGRRLHVLARCRSAGWLYRAGRERAAPGLAAAGRFPEPSICFGRGRPGPASRLRCYRPGMGRRHCHITRGQTQGTGVQGPPEASSRGGGGPSATGHRPLVCVRCRVARVCPAGRLVGFADSVSR